MTLPLKYGVDLLRNLISYETPQRGGSYWWPGGSGYEMIRKSNETKATLAGIDLGLIVVAICIIIGVAKDRAKLANPEYVANFSKKVVNFNLENRLKSLSTISTATKIVLYYEIISYSLLISTCICAKKSLRFRI